MKKLKIPQIYSQRDSRWVNILLGYNTQPQYSIGMYGCLITCLGMMVSKTPDEVNTILKNNNGFTPGGGNFYWNKSSVLGINQEYVSSYYDGPVSTQGLTKIKELLDNNYPILCEIDFVPSSEAVDMHYVLLIGYDEDQILAADPWTGQIISLDVYGGASRAIIQFRSYNKTFEDEDDSQIALLERQYALCRFDRDSHWDELQDLKKKYGELETNYNLLLGLKQKLEKENDVLLLDYQKLQDITNKQIDSINWQIGDLTAKNEELKAKIVTLESTLNGTNNEALVIENEGLKERIEQLQKEIDNISNKYNIKLKAGKWAIVEILY